MRDGTPVKARAWFAALLSLASTARAADEVRYNRDVRPILADACFRCHGPGVKKAGLRLDRRDAALAPTESGAVAIVPGNANESEVIRRILTDDEDERMPPAEAKKTLEPKQKE